MLLENGTIAAMDHVYVTRAAFEALVKELGGQAYHWDSHCRVTFKLGNGLTAQLDCHHYVQLVNDRLMFNYVGREPTHYRLHRWTYNNFHFYGPGARLSEAKDTFLARFEELVAQLTGLSSPVDRK